jgi:thiamine biosynthesis lipoprotein
MNSSSPRHTPDETRGDRFARLLEMGFERTDPAPATTESIRLDDGTHKVTQLCAAMGSFVAVTALHDSRARAEHAIGTAFEEMGRLIDLLNRFDAASPLSCLNDTGRLAGAPEELVAVVDRALEYGRGSAGAFDITVKPVIDLFRDPATYEPRTPPDDATLRDALELVGAEHLRVDGRDLRLTRAGMGLTLDGIAKGYVVDGLAATLQSSGVSRFLINAGGDIRTGGDRGDASPWTIAVRDPDAGAPSWDSDAWDRAVVPDALRLTDGAVATSGSYEVYFDSERLAHHIVQARTGRSPIETLSVTVTAATTTEADALATAVFVLGAARGRNLVDARPGCECLIIDRAGNQIRSRGWRGNPAPSREQT